MPCYTIRSTPIRFENVAFKPGHMAIMIEALEAMGYEIEHIALPKSKNAQADYKDGLVLYPKGAWRSRENRISYANGQFTVPEQMANSFNLERVQNAYGMTAAKVTAKKNGWLFKQTSETEFEFQRR